MKGGGKYTARLNAINILLQLSCKFARNRYESGIDRLNRRTSILQFHFPCCDQQFSCLLSVQIWEAFSCRSVIPSIAAVLALKWKSWIFLYLHEQMYWPLLSWCSMVYTWLQQLSSSSFLKAIDLQPDSSTLLIPFFPVLLTFTLHHWFCSFNVE